MKLRKICQNKGMRFYSIEGGYRSYLRKKLADFMKEDDGTAERLADKAADAERSIIKNLKDRMETFYKSDQCV